jgi:hypothetical protein
MLCLADPALLQQVTQPNHLLLGLRNFLAEPLDAGVRVWVQTINGDLHLLNDNGYRFLGEALERFERFVRLDVDIFLFDPLNMQRAFYVAHL